MTIVEIKKFWKKRTNAIMRDFHKDYTLDGLDTDLIEDITTALDADTDDHFEEDVSELFDEYDALLLAFIRRLEAKFDEYDGYYEDDDEESEEPEVDDFD